MTDIITRSVGSYANTARSDYASGLRKRFLDDGLKRSPLIDTVIETPVQPGPDIQWHPSYETYQERVKALSALKLDRPETVPSNFPEKVDGSRAWTGVEYEDESRYVVELSEADVFEIERALSSFKSMKYD